MTTAASAVQLTPVKLDTFLDDIRPQVGADSAFQRLERKIAEATTIAADLSREVPVLNLLHTPIGPLLHSGEDLSALGSKIGVKNLIPEFMVNQASRLLDFLNVVCKYQPKSIQEISPERSMPVTLGGEKFLIKQSIFGDGHRYLYFQKNTSDNPIKFNHWDPYFHYRFEPNLDGYMVSFGSFPSQYHQSGFARASSLHSFALAGGSYHKDLRQLEFQQGRRDGSGAAKLRLEYKGSTPALELASWYDDTAKKVSPVSNEKFLSEEQYIVSAK